MSHQVKREEIFNYNREWFWILKTYTDSFLTVVHFTIGVKNVFVITVENIKNITNHHKLVHVYKYFHTSGKWPSNNSNSQDSEYFTC